jgi:hypothetical protein
MPQVYTFKKKVALASTQSFTFAPTDRIHEYEVCVQWTANSSVAANPATVTASAVNTEGVEFAATTFKATDGNACVVITTLNPKIKVVLAQGLLADGETDAVSTATVYLTATAAYLADDDGLAYDAGTAS